MKQTTLNPLVQRFLLAVGAAALVLVGGCHTAHVANPLTAELAANDPDAQLNFWHTLATRTLTSNDEAFHGLLLYLDGKDDSASYADRVANLKSRQMLPGGFDAPADQAVQRGPLAVAICRTLQIKGGVMMWLTQSTPRYAVRELQFLEIYPLSSPQQTFSGGEFVAMIGRIEDYQRQAALTAGPPMAEVAPTTQPVAQ